MFKLFKRKRKKEMSTIEKEVNKEKKEETPEEEAFRKSLKKENLGEFVKCQGLDFFIVNKGFPMQVKILDQNEDVLYYHTDPTKGNEPIEVVARNNTPFKMFSAGFTMHSSPLTLITKEKDTVTEFIEVTPSDLDNIGIEVGVKGRSYSHPLKGIEALRFREGHNETLDIVRRGKRIIVESKYFDFVETSYKLDNKGEK